jgi:MoaA/NifB/PqqE/SkfB family radical SAM enzyme
VCASLLSPAEALERFRRVKREVRNLTVAGIAGPGDSLANFEQTRETFELIRREDPKITLCLSTNGLLLPRYIRDLAILGLSHITITINAVDAGVGKKIIDFVDFEGRRMKGEAAAEVLLNNQLEGLARAAEAGMVCKVNCVMLKGVNEGHIPALIKRIKNQGASIANIMQLIPVKGSVFEDMPLINNAELLAMRKQCETILPQMYHCRQCRADAIGPLHQDVSCLYTKEEARPAAASQEPKDPAAEKTLLFAVASRDGRLVDQHFGHVEEFYIYIWENGQVTLKERRPVRRFCTGNCRDHEDRLTLLAETVEDCAGVISQRIGDRPRSLLESRGIRVYMTYNRVEEAVNAAAQHYTTGSSEIFLPVI